MESLTFVLLLITLVTIGIIVAGLRSWFERIGRYKRQQIGRLIPFWRRWKPSDPSRCAGCRAEAAVDTDDGTPPHPAPIAWSVNKSKRGHKKSLDSAGHYCPNPDCLYHLNPDPQIHALVSNGHRGRQFIRQWVCQACGTYVSEHHNTALS